jgi:hypothetical protein
MDPQTASELASMTKKNMKPSDLKSGNREILRCDRSGALGMPARLMFVKHVLRLCRARHKRRTMLTTLSRAGVPLRTVQDISGHSNLAALSSLKNLKMLIRYRRDRFGTYRRDRRTIANYLESKSMRQLGVGQISTPEASTVDIRSISPYLIRAVKLRSTNVVNR